MSWQTKKLTEICKISTGKWDANHAIENGKFRFYTCAKKHLNCDTKKFSGKCLIFPGNGANVGDVYYYNGDFDAYQRTYVVHDISITPEFLMYHMMMNWRDINLDKQYGAATNFIKIGNFNNYEVSFPEPVMQKKIVSELDIIFTEIDKLILDTIKLKKNAEIIFESSLEKLFNNTMYKEHELGSVCKFVGGSQPAKSYFEYKSKKTNVRLIQIRDYKSNNYIVYIPKEKTKKFCKAGDVMIGRYGPPIFQILRGLEGAYNVALMKAIPQKPITNEYLYWFLKNKRIQDYVIKKSIRAAGQSGVNKEALEPYKINLPSVNEQNKIVKNIEKIQEQSKFLSTLYSNKLEILTKLKQTFLKNKIQKNKVA